MGELGGLLATGLYTGTDVPDAVLTAVTLILLLMVVAAVFIYMHGTGGHHRPTH